MEEIKLAVKASGDFTQYMQNHLQAGMEAHVEGGTGCSITGRAAGSSSGLPAELG